MPTKIGKNIVFKCELFPVTKTLSICHFIYLTSDTIPVRFKYPLHFLKAKGAKQDEHGT